MSNCTFCDVPIKPCEPPCSDWGCAFRTHLETTCPSAVAVQIRVKQKESRQRSILVAIQQERNRQDARFGETDPSRAILDTSFTQEQAAELASFWKQVNRNRFLANKPLSWAGILLEEVGEALEEVDPEKQRTELIQAAAVLVQIIEVLEQKARS